MAIDNRTPRIEQGDTLEVLAVDADTVVLRLQNGERYRARALPDADHVWDPLRPGDRLVVTNNPAEWGFTMTERLTGQGDAQVRDGGQYGLEGFQALPERA